MGFYVAQRLVMAIMGFLAIVNAYTMRICISMAIVELVVKKNHTGTDHVVCDQYMEDLRASTPLEDRYNWSEELQGRILASFYVGYVITHIPGGMLADKFGGKWTLGLGIFSTALFTLITPYTIIHGGPQLLIMLRIFMGLGEGTTFPALSCLLAKWVPPGERGKLGALVLGGGQIGAILGNSLSGVIIANFDWKMVFYFFGGLAILWFIVFCFTVFSTPSQHPYISEYERDFLIRVMDSSAYVKNLHPTPWVAIITNIPVLAMIIAQIGHDWGFFIMVTDLPKYMSDVMQFSIKANGYLSSLPYVFMWIVSISSGFVGDYLIHHNVLNTTNVRKLMTGIAAFGPAIFMVAASYAGCNHVIVVAYFTIAMGLMGTYYSGMKLSPLDMTTNYAGTVMALTNGIAATTGIVAPYLIGVLTPNATLLEWRLVFWIAFIVLFVTAIIYCIWASGEIQPFNDPVTLKEYQDRKKRGGI